MKKLKTGCKIISFIIAFCLIFVGLQNILTPKYLDGSTAMVDGFYNIDDNCVDVLFMGASQMFCTVDAKKLTDEYGISSYDFGAGNQYLACTYYYLQEALKKQNPKVIMVEICTIFDKISEIEDVAISMSYAPMPLTREKWASLNKIFAGDIKESIKYCIPLFAYHSRWNQLSKEDLTYLFNSADEYSATRGFYRRDHIEEKSIFYLGDDDGEIREIPKESVEAIFDIVNLCKENNIDVVFFKAPVSNWTRNDSKAVRNFMNENNLKYFEMNDYFDEIGIDNKKDFYNSNHLNITGAQKATDFIAQYLLENYDDLA